MSGKPTIPCAVCQDLLPLVQEGVASEASAALVAEHLAGCPACRALGEVSGGRASMPDDNKVLGRLRRRLWRAGVLALLAGCLVGAGLTATAGTFYNLALMPALGMLGYAALRGRGLWAAPLAWGVNLAWGAVQVLLGSAWAELFTFGVYGGIYAVLCGLGWLAAALLHYAFGKGEGRQ